MLKRISGLTTYRNHALALAQKVPIPLSLRSCFTPQQLCAAYSIHAVLYEQKAYLV